MAVFLHTLQKIHVEMQKDTIKRLTSSRSFLLVHPMVAAQEACVALLQPHDAFRCLNVHLAGEKMKERVFLHSLLAELVPSYMTEEERVHVTGYADVIFKLHILKQIDYHCKNNESFGAVMTAPKLYFLNTPSFPSLPSPVHRATPDVRQSSC